MSHKNKFEMATGARMLGLASIAIGVAEMAAPERVQAMLGLEDDPQRRGVLRVLGVRELCHGFNILTQAKPTSGVWARVLGDVLDSALLAAAAPSAKNPVKFAATSSGVMAIGAAD